MAKKHKGRPVHGWVVVDKESGPTSTAVTNKVRSLFQARKAGHGGTLDPLATGVLPIALGEATKTVPFIMEGIKAYRFTLHWGVETDSCDSEGKVVETSSHRPGQTSILAALPTFMGEIEQVPPIFSAIRVEGKRAYDLAREGRPPNLAARSVLIHDLTFVKCTTPEQAMFEVTCGKGVYVRSLARDLARALGTVGHVSALRRTRVGPFEEAGAIPLAELVERAHNPARTVKESLLPVQVALDGIPALSLKREEASRLRNGQGFSLLAKSDLDRIAGLEPNGLVQALEGDRLVALVRYGRGAIHPVRLFVY